MSYPQHEIENDFCPFRGVGIVASHFLACPVAACLAVKGIAHGIQDRRLPGSGRAADQEEMASLQFFEVDDGLARIGTEGTHRQFQRFHFAFSFLYTSSQTS